MVKFTGMEPREVMRELKRNREVFSSLLDGLDGSLVYWKPAVDKWCLLEIVCHLLDEEREDFRARAKLLLESPGKAFAPIDPVGWVVARNYIHQDFGQTLQRFLEERAQSLQWLYSLQDPDWSQFCLHPKMGRVSAGMFLYSWLAHDYLHIRQITRTKYQYLSSHAPEPIGYAGEWIPV
jgi:hypothetical protein